jgi:phage-related protein
MAAESRKALRWVGASKKELMALPEEVQQVMGYALFLAEIGGKHPDAKALQGHKGASVLEIVEDFDSDTYRTVYTVKFAKAVYVLHAFQKKSPKGIKTAKHTMDLIQERLRIAERLYVEEFGSTGKKGNKG